MMRFLALVLFAAVLGATNSATQAQETLPSFKFEDVQKHFEQMKRRRLLSRPEKVERETRFSYWGYRHDEMHTHQLIDELQKTTGSQCCDGPHSGECRISEVNMQARLVLVDGLWCPMTNRTKVAPLEGLQDFKDGDRAIAVVCAGQGWKNECPAAYCVGIEPKT